MPLTNLLGRLRFTRNDGVELLRYPVDGDRLAQDLADALPGFLKWEWDGQFDGALALVEVDAGEQVRSVLVDRFAHSWDCKSLRRAPQDIKDSARAFRGLQARQQLFATGLDNGLVLLGLWWPWGHGATISLRLVPYAPHVNVAGLDT